MNVSRIAILGIALVAGAAAFFLMMGNSSDNPVVQVVEPVKEETTRVLIATRNIERGERLGAGRYKLGAMAQERHCSRILLRMKTQRVREELTNAVARSLIVAGEPLVNAKVVAAGSSGLMAAILSPGMRAVTLRVSAETSSGGFILPGDRVDLLHTVNGRTRMMFEEVRVLAVNTVYSENAETPNIAGTNLTLELSPRDAEAFTTARSNGSISAVLRSIFKPEGEAVADDRRSSDVNVIRYGRS